MQNTFGTLVAIGLVGCGFLLTGDLGWCVRQASQAFERPTSSPGPKSPEKVPDAPAHPALPATPVVAARRPPAGTVDRVDLARLTLGQRVVVWTAAGGREPACHVVHVLEPTTGDALLERRESAGAGSTRRGIVSAGSPAGAFSGGILTLRGTLRMQPLGVVHGTAAAVETNGPIVALAVE